LALPFYDAVSDFADLRQIMEPTSEETGTNPLDDLNLTPASTNDPSRARKLTAGTIPYDEVSSRPQQQSGTLPAANKRAKNSKPFDIFLAISTAFVNTLPGISLDDIRFKGSQQMLQFTKLPENLQSPRDPQKLIEYKGWRNTAETFLNAYGSTLAIFKARKWYREIKMTSTILAAYLQLIGTPHDAILTSTQMHSRHNQCVFENLDLSSRNFNILQSVVFLFTFLVKVSEIVLALFQNI
jgi:hypothetical protein